jgi:hypothetical protein
MSPDIGNDQHGDHEAHLEPQVLDAIREVLLQHMDEPGTLEVYRIQDALPVDVFGNAIEDEGLVEVAGLILTMRDGRQLRLTLTVESQPRSSDPVYFPCKDANAREKLLANGFHVSHEVDVQDGSGPRVWLFDNLNGWDADRLALGVRVTPPDGLKMVYSEGSRGFLAPDLNGALIEPLGPRRA